MNKDKKIERLEQKLTKAQEDFEGFTAKLNSIRLKYHLTDMAFLLPPKQRAIARFMNLFDWVQWAGDVLGAYPELTPKQQEAFVFVVENKICVEPPDRIALFFLEMPLSMHFVALILQNCFFKSTFFRNFAVKDREVILSRHKKD